MNWLIRKVRNYHAHFILISLFVFTLLVSCKNSPTAGAVSVVWKNSKAVALAVPASFLNDHSSQSLKVQLMNGPSKIDVLGQIRNEGDTIFFDPVVPFTRGLRYKVFADTTTVAEIKIPESDLPSPQLLSVYPTQDTVPENLLKIYLRFSQPMEEGRSLSHITLLRNNDTLKGTFLDLQPELWNDEGTILTMWLDPGRIKRDLIPNKEMGTPLSAGENYDLVIHGNWRSKEGKPITGILKKSFVAIPRDERSPASDQWKLTLPLSATTQSLTINFNEPLDFSLANESISIFDKDGNLVSGLIEVLNEETQWKFSPSRPWAKGNYLIKIESTLEDLAGNNLNRLFDKDLTKKSSQSERRFFEKPFVVH